MSKSGVSYNSMTTFQTSTINARKNQVNFIFILAIWFLTSILTSCSNLENNTTEITTNDTARVQTLAPLERDTIATIKQNSTLLFISQAKKIDISKRANSPFNKLDYNKVIAYDYDGGKGEGVIDIISNGKLAQTVKQQKELTQEQIDDLTNYLGANSTYGGNKAFCFEPHLGIVFYKDSKVVAHLSICLECNYMNSSIKIPAIEVKKVKIGDNDEYPSIGFSKLGRQKINALCKQLNFSHCADTLNSIFDE